MACPMTDARQAFQKIVDYCNDRWLEAEEAPATPYDAPGTKTGRKMAYNDVLQFARRMQADEKG